MIEIPGNRRAVIRWMVLTFGALLGGGSFTADAQTVPAGFIDSVAIDGLVQPVAIEFAPDGSVFVAEKRGTIKVYDDLLDTTPTIFADLSIQVHDFWDRGMLGLAVHPSYPIEPYVYVLYTMDAPIGGTAPVFFDGCADPTGVGCTVGARLSRLTASGGVMIGSEDVFIEDWCQQFPSHSIGCLEFGPDGALYVSSGDGASFNYVDSGQGGNPCGDPFDEGGALRSQDIAGNGDPLGLNGTILRLDPFTGAAMPDNPLVGGDPADDRIIAYGLRNPYRFAVHPQWGELWIGDVGWGTYEEINRIVDPLDAVVENFGWPCYEGAPVHGGYAPLALCQSLYAAGTASPPFYEYNHSEFVASGACPVGTSAITGLAFYDGGTYPAEYDGALFFNDYSRRCVWVMFADGTGTPDPTNRATFVVDAGPVVDLEIGPGGDLFYVNIEGSIHRVRDLVGSTPPIVSLEVTTTSGPAPLMVGFDASGSFDPDPGDTISFAWDLDGDGAFDDAVGPTTNWTYFVSGSHLATVRVTDDNGVNAFASQVIAVDNAPPEVTILAPDPLEAWQVGDTIEFLAFATDPDVGFFDPAGFLWEVILHHCHVDDPSDCHEHFVLQFPGVDSGSITAPDHSYPSFLEFRLTATDGGVGDWWSADWARRRLLQIDNSSQSSDLYDFPVLVRVDLSNLTGVALDGADLRFIDPDGTVLAHEIEQLTPGGLAEIWVRVPHIPAAVTTDSFWLYYDNPAATDAQSDAVWSNGYVGVWHLSDLTDAGPFGHDGTSFGATTTAGVIGEGRAFDGATQYIDVGNGASLALTNAVSIEAWVAIDNPDEAEFMRIVSKKSVWNGGNGYSLRYNPEQNRLSVLGSGDDVGDANSVDLDTEWHYVVGTILGGEAHVYTDGIEVTTDSVVNPLVAGVEPVHIGKRSGGDNHFDGRIDEVRISTVARSADWVRAQYASMTNTLLTVGAEQQAGALSTTVSVFLYPDSVVNPFETDPPGLTLVVGEVEGPAPFGHEAIIGSTVTCTAPSPQTLSGATYEFTSWSDGGDQLHSFVAGAAPVTRVATYTATSTFFLRGDVNDDLTLDLADAILALDYLFGSATIDCADALDANDDGGLDVADPIALLAHLFQSAPPPPPPFGPDASGCGTDPTVDGLECAGSQCP